MWIGDPRTAERQLAHGYGKATPAASVSPHSTLDSKAYPDVEEFRKTHQDLMKKAICADNGVRLVVVTYRLSPKGILKRIPKTLRARRLTFAAGTDYSRRAVRQLPSQCPRPLVGVNALAIGSES